MAPPLQPLSLSLQFARFDGAAEHRAALPRHKVVRWIRHALALPAEVTVRIVARTKAVSSTATTGKKTTPPMC